MFEKLSPAKKEHYIKLLQATGSLSKLFNETSDPFLYYRAHENIFCLALGAENLSRSDLSYDAKIGSTGYGLKTFLHQNGKTFQKVAEFNTLSTELRKLKGMDLIKRVSELRNKRIETTDALHKVTKSLYHCVTRKDGVFFIYELPLEPVQIASLKIKEDKTNTIIFTDGKNEYTYSISKSTLLKRFNLSGPALAKFDVKVLDNPFDEILKLSPALTKVSKKSTLHPGIDFVFLPLYSRRDKETLEQAERSGLNQWNADGRPRDPDEVYIPIPSWIHEYCEGFFPDNVKTQFELILPDGTTLNAKLCQSGLKGLLSNPNKALGKWLLRDVLKLREGTVVTRKILNEADIDSVMVTKIKSGVYKIDFASVGKFEEFEEGFVE